jgi:DNA polymerase-1
LAGSIVNRAAIAITREFKRRGIDGWCCAQIHDQLIFNVEKSRAEEARRIVQELMETTTKLSIPLKAPACLGQNWKEAH